MATIKIDRGFTQKIQQKGLIHSPDQAPQPHKHNINKKPKGRSNVLAFALIGGAALLGLIVLVAVFSGGDKDKKKSPQPAAAAPATQSGHWKPTGAATMHSGQIGRPHRVHPTGVARSGCR